MAVQEEAPWLQEATLLVLEEMRRRTRLDGAGFRTPPLLLSGPLDTGKSP